MSGVISRRLVPQGLRVIARCTSQQAPKTSQPEPNPNVPGLSKNCVDVPTAPVGPGAAKDKEYKNPEYFCYHENSFAEAEVEMAKFRLPAPSNKRKFVPQ